jgi:ATP-dependent DNA helicase RecG
MARRRFRSNQRHEPSTERSFQEFLLSTPALQTSRTELMRLIRGGEDSYLELKVKLSNTEKITQEIVALANTDGGVIIFGVNDQLRVEGVDDSESVQDELVRICREEITPPLVPLIDRVSFDNGRRIVALEIDPKRRPYRTKDGRYYIRVGSEKRETTREELSSLLDEARPIKLEDVATPGARLSDIDEALLWSFIRSFEGDAFVESTSGGYPTGDLLERDLLLATKIGDETTPTVAGLLLFGLDARVPELIPRSTVMARRYAGDSMQAPEIEAVKLTGNLYTLYEAAGRFISRYCDLWEGLPKRSLVEDPSDSPVEARANYHRDSVQEALVNLLVHRDLSLRDISTRINVFDHSIEFVNPRRSAGFTPAVIRAVRFGIPQRLNPQIKAIFTNIGYGLKLPTGGMPALLKQSRLFSGKRTEIHAFNDEFRMRMYGR